MHLPRIANYLTIQSEKANHSNHTILTNRVRYKLVCNGAQSIKDS